MELGAEEVALGEVPAGMTAGLALRQRAGLLDAIVAVLVRERGVGSGQAEAELAEGARDAGRARVAIAVVQQLGQRRGVVERPRGAAGPEAILLPAEAAHPDRRHDLASLAAPARDEIDGAAERVAPEQGRGAADDLDSLDVVEWNQRSEEHTSELQSRPHLVCRLLLEKKIQLTRIKRASFNSERSY